MVTKWLRRNRISSPLLSSRFWRNIRRLRKYLAPRSLSFRFLPCPALPFRDYASNFCNRFACSNFFTVRKRKVDQKSGYPLDYAIGCTVHVPPPLDPRIYAIIQTVYLWTERAFLVFVFSFFSLSLSSNMHSHGIWSGRYPRDWWMDLVVFRMSTKPHSKKRQSEQERGGVGIRVPRGIRILPSSSWLHAVLRVRVWRSSARVLHGRIDVQVGTLFKN